MSRWREIRAIGPLSAGRLSLLVCGVLALVVGVPYGLITGLTDDDQGLATAVLLPVICAGFGGVGGILTGVLYNVTARAVGGLEIEVEP